MENRIVTIISHNKEYVRKFLEEAQQDWIKMGYLSKMSISRDKMFCYVAFDKNDQHYYGWEWFPLNNEPRGRIFNDILVDVNIPIEVLEQYILPRFRGNMDTDIKYFDSYKDVNYENTEIK